MIIQLIRRTTLGGLCLLACNFGFSQKGLPPGITTTATVNTRFPAQVDFRESMTNQLKVPEGYTLSVAATGLGKPRMMAVTKDGSIYVTRRDVGDVLLLQKENDKGEFTRLTTVVSQFNGVHGITIHNDHLYLCSAKKLARGKINADGTIGKLDTLINDLPDGGQHDNRTIAFGPDNKLYITVGSDCNDCSETNPEHATILQANEDGTARKIFARGLRNTIGFDWHPQTKELWGLDHGTDWRGDEIPPEELNKIVEKGDYGWPLVYGKQSVDNTREDPVGTTKELYAKTTVPAVMLFPAHSAPLDFKFLDKKNAIITWHGSWNRNDPQGYKLQILSFNDKGEPGEIKDFLSGFLSEDGKSTFARPTGLAIAGNGSIYISDDASGVIYQLKKSK